MSVPRSRTALITGAGRGVGRALAIALARAGASVALIARSADELAETRRECLAFDVATSTVVCDLTDWGRTGEALDLIRGELGPIDLLVNNAGRADARPAPLWETDPTDWRATVETNLFAPFVTCHALIPDMIARGGGRIVNVGTLMAVAGQSHYPAYSVSKAALMRLTDCLAGPLGPSNVTVFDVSPGPVPTRMSLSMPMMRRLAPEAWSNTQAIEGIVLAIAEGRLDALSGRFIDASLDDLDELLAQAHSIRAGDARTLRLSSYGPRDPVGRAADRLRHDGQRGGQAVQR